MPNLMQIAGEEKINTAVERNLTAAALAKAKTELRGIGYANALLNAELNPGNGKKVGQTWLAVKLMLGKAEAKLQRKAAKDAAKAAGKKGR